jgi:hypothetical protein
VQLGDDQCPRIPLHYGGSEEDALVGPIAIAARDKSRQSESTESAGSPEVHQEEASGKPGSQSGASRVLQIHGGGQSVGPRSNQTRRYEASP